jgi:hypothetical protein
MAAEIHAAELSQRHSVLHALSHPLTPRARSRMKRFAGGAVGMVVHPLRAIKPLDWLAAKAFQAWYGLPVSPTHFYSPLPDVAEVERTLPHWYREQPLDGIEMDFHKQSAFLKDIAYYSAECALLPSVDRITAQGYGLGFGEVEAMFLHCILRHLRPARMIEIGSGVSTYFALHALEVNAVEANCAPQLICIEPYPRPRLRQWVEEKRVESFEEKVQDVDPAVFDLLGEGDVLFIDSSHVSKVDSDVNFLFFKILPRLKKGVVIHLHDIPFPYLTCPPGHSMFEKSLLWNEAALLYSFLMWNKAFEILLCQSYMHLRAPESLKAIVDVYDPSRHFPTSLWLRKTE